MHEKPRSSTLRWSLWLGFTALWTAALLTQLPLFARDAVVSEDIGFSLGKLLHVAAYAVFTSLTALLPLPLRWRWALLGFLSFHAMATEYLQQFVERSGSWLDVGLDHVGIVVGVVVMWKRWFRGRRGMPSSSSRNV